jgi:hypothetical protein
MAGETDVVENEIEQTGEVNPLTAEQIQQAETEEAAAFAQSFDKETRVEESAPVEQDPAQAEDPAADGAVGEETPATEGEPPIEEETATLTVKQLTEMLGKLQKIDEYETLSKAEQRKLHGKIGELNQSLQALQKNGSTAAVKLTGNKFKRLYAEYPDLAELLAEDLNDTGTEATDKVTDDPDKENEPKPALDAKTFNEEVAKVKETLQNEMQTNLLRIQHDDWEMVVSSDNYQIWKQTLSPEDQVQLEDSWDAVYLGKKITEFKSWFEKKQTGIQERESRLKNSIVPKGREAALKPVAMTEQDGFNAAFIKK